ncbi:MAG: hypothetical protein GEU71_00010 [Actinobacteria bacterium]|nr:hypothetical protein [Actinomycetota bacterium]
MKDVERALKAALTAELDPLKMPDRLAPIRRRARRQRLLMAMAGGICFVAAVVSLSLAATSFGERTPDKVVDPAPTLTEGASNFGRFHIMFGGGFDSEGRPLEKTGIVEINARIGSACFTAQILGSASAHLHRQGEDDPVVTFFEPPQPYRSTTCVKRQSVEAMRQILDDPRIYFIEFHSSNGDTLVSDLEPFVYEEDGDEPEPENSQNPECPEGIEGRGLGDIEFYPPKPYFEEFNLWRTEIPNTGRGCLIIAAGQQASYTSDGEDDPTTYGPNGALFIFGDYRRDPDGITGAEVPLPRPVRIIGFRGAGLRALLRLQSLEDCSTIAYDVWSITFVEDPFESPPPCPIDPGR